MWSYLIVQRTYLWNPYQRCLARNFSFQKYSLSPELLVGVLYGTGQESLGRTLNVNQDSQNLISSLAQLSGRLDVRDPGLLGLGMLQSLGLLDSYNFLNKPTKLINYIEDIKKTINQMYKMSLNVTKEMVGCNRKQIYRNRKISLTMSLQAMAKMYNSLTRSRYATILLFWLSAYWFNGKIKPLTKKRWFMTTKAYVNIFEGNNFMSIQY